MLHITAPSRPSDTANGTLIKWCQVQRQNSKSKVCSVVVKEVREGEQKGNADEALVVSSHQIVHGS